MNGAEPNDSSPPVAAAENGSDISDRKRARIKELLLEVNALAIALKQVSARHQQQGELPAGARSVLEILAANGPQTVPRIARERSTSRQNIQILVDHLAEQGCVQLTSNPAHKRSGLVQLTEKGRSLLEASSAGETEFLNLLSGQAAEEPVLAAAQLLRELRQAVSGSVKPRERSLPKPEESPSAGPGPSKSAIPAQESPGVDLSELPVSLL